MLSGIGDFPKLQELGIEPLVDLPDVGMNLSDHPYIPTIYKSPHATEAYNSWLKTDNVGQHLKEWQENGTGPLTSSIGNHIAFLRLPEEDAEMKKHGDPSTGPSSPHYELLFIVSINILSHYMIMDVAFIGWSSYTCSATYPNLLRGRCCHIS
jgi:choline dehydrogenase-like flavoprotein